MSLPALVDRVLRGQRLSEADAETAIGAMLDGSATDAQIGALLGGMRVRGETVDELTGAARGLMARAHPFRTPPGVDIIVDTCGTGGDGSHSLNISTIAAIVVAACGVPVAKHGNRSVSSQTGSADLVAALGIDLDAPHDRLERALADVHLTFLYAPRFHPALQRVKAARRELGTRTLFNLLGPLANPARASHRVVGVFDPAYVDAMAEALARLGVASAAVVHGEGGLDELHPSGTTDVVFVAAGRREARQLTPRDFGLGAVDPATLGGGDVTHNLRLTEALLDGRSEPAAARQAIVMTAALALSLARGLSLTDAATRARQALADGAGRALVDRWRTIAGKDAP